MKNISSWFCCLLLLSACTGDVEETPGAGVKETGSAASLSQAKPGIDENGIQRRPLFGDLHVHSSWSLDSYVNFNPVDPAQAYRFARGEEVTIAGGRRLQLARPLDFAAVTDHAEFLGELFLCLDPEVPQYDLPVCEIIRNEQHERELVTRVYKELLIPNNTSPSPRRDKALCGAEDSACRERTRSMWQQVVDVADAHNSPGEFTTFVAYEWSGATHGNNLHRNVIFRNNQVPALPISYFEATTPASLWQQLREECQAPCEVLAIPHNSNQSRGQQFPVTLSRAEAELRRELEPLVEIVQGKGESECKLGVGTADEYCDFEKLERRPVCSVDDEDGAADCVRVCEVGDEDGNCIQPGIYLRNALKDGLRLGGKLGVNPYKFGVIGSTDNHNGTPGASDESQYAGMFGEEDATPELRAKLPEIKQFKPPRTHSAAGLAAVWAEENTRASIFAALKRREAFATSGTRMVLRFFGGWDLGEDRAKGEDLAIHGYQRGVAMGADLPPRRGSAAPEFLVWAMKAPGKVQLQRLQIIKGWLEDDNTREMTYDVLCSDGLQPDQLSHRCPDNGASVDLASCEVSSDLGAVELQGYWQDPDFHPERAAFYYVRVLENPSCRWSTWEAIREGRPLFEDVPPLIQERAWSSPIWYQPG